MESGDEQPALETPLERRERWRSVYIIYFTMFQMSLGFSIVLTGVWPYLDKLEPGSQKEILGLAVGANPLGQLVFSPLLGLWANRAGSVRAPMLATLVLFVLASALYAQLHLTRPYAKYWMVFARFLVGVSSSNIAVARSYLSSATLVCERTRCVAAVSLAQVLGFVVGPALQAAAAPLGAGVACLAPLRLDMYTAAGWINALLGLLNLLLFLPCCFKERKIAAREAMIAHGKETEKEALKAMKPDLVSSWTLIAAFFVMVFNFVLLETLATSLTMDQFAWSKRQALEFMGAIMSAGAVIACVTFACIAPLTRLFEERALLLWGGFLLTGLASVLCVPWGPGPPPPAPPGAAEAGGGCPADTQPWCLTTRGLTLPQFLAGYACISVGYSLGVTLIQTIFSKVLGPRPQGVWMGVMTGAGCLSRALGPVFVAAVYARRGPAASFGSTAALTLASLVALRAVYPRLRPPSPPPSPPPDHELRPLQPEYPRLCPPSPPSPPPDHELRPLQPEYPRLCPPSPPPSPPPDHELRPLQPEYPRLCPPSPPPSPPPDHELRPLQPEYPRLCPPSPPPSPPPDHELRPLQPEYPRLCPPSPPPSPPPDHELRPLQPEYPRLCPPSPPSPPPDHELRPLRPEEAAPRTFVAHPQS